MDAINSRRRVGQGRFSWCGEQDDLFPWLESLNARIDDAEIIERLHVAHGVLDAQFLLPTTNLACALSDATIGLFSIRSTAIQQLGIYSILSVPGSTLCLSLSPTSMTTTLVTLSDGTTMHVSLEADNVSVLNVAQTSSFQSWCAIPYGQDTIVAGGDDGCMVTLDKSTFSVLCRDRKSHTAGITALLEIEVGSQALLCTGSYDGFLRVFKRDIQTNTFVLLDSAQLDGGVWRLYPQQQRQQQQDNSVRLLACCMQSGTRSLTVTLSHDNTIHFTVDNLWTADGSTESTRLIYAGAWLPLDKAAICSFYEKILYILEAPP